MPVPIPELHAAQRVAAQHSVSEATDRLTGTIGPLSDGERSERLVNAAAAVWDAAWGPRACRADIEPALVRCLAEGQAWLEDLMAEDAR